MGNVADRLARLIATSGPISVGQYMAEANAYYYATRDPLGAAGDFVTAPEISQMFGELVGACLADLWDRAGRPGGACYVELGPGRGTLAADALRAMRPAGLDPAVELVETSPVLRRAQAGRGLERELARRYFLPPGRRAAARRRQRVFRRSSGPPAGRGGRGMARADGRRRGRTIPPGARPASARARGR